MTRRAQTWLVLNGAIFVLLAMLIGIPGFQIAVTHPRVFDEWMRQFLRQSHSILVLTGVWLIASGAILPLLDLSSRGIWTVVISLLVNGWAFVGTMPFQFIALHWNHQRINDSPLWNEFIVLMCIAGAGALLGGVLMIWGACKALRQSKISTVH